MRSKDDYTTVMDRAELLHILKRNREQHEKDFNRALKKWKKECRKALAAALKKYDTEGWVNLNLFKDLPKPNSYLNSYDSAIKRVTLDTRDSVELGSYEFSAWVEDEWEWRGLFAANTGTYLSR